MNEATAAAAPAEAEGTRLTASVALATIGAATLASLIVPGSRAGLGLALASLAVLLAAAIGSEAERSGWRLTMIVTAGLLATVSLLRDAAWLVTLDLIAALFFAAIGLAGERSSAGFIRVPAVFLVGLFAGPTEVVKGASDREPVLAAPASGAVVIRAALLTTGLVALFASLFAWADGAFAHLFGELSPDLGALDLPVRVGTALWAIAVGGSLALFAREEPAAAADTKPPPRSLAPLEWGAALGALVLLFTGFVAVQFVVLFGGDQHVLDTAGLTYAEYAREGFVQLLFVALLVLAVVGAAMRYARAIGSRERLALRSLLTALCCLTLVILASALHRLDLYVDAFGATRERLVAVAICALVGSILIAAVVSLFTSDRRWLPRAIALLAAIAAISLTLVDPDARVAERNVDRYEAAGSFDESYNSRLSADATPALTELPSPVAAEVLERQRDRLAEADGFWGANVGRSQARAALESP
jgi:hypothetical protein